MEFMFSEEKVCSAYVRVCLYQVGNAIIGQDKGWGTDSGRVGLCVVTREDFSHKTVFEQRPQGLTVWRKSVPGGRDSKYKCSEVSTLGCGITLPTEAQLADGMDVEGPQRFWHK